MVEVESLETRIKMLQEDNKRYNSEIQEKINENEQLRCDMAEMEIEVHDLKMSKLELARY